MSSLQEGLAGVRVVQSFAARSGPLRRRTAARSRAQVSAWRRISLVNIGFFPMIAFAQALALAAVLVVGGYLERHGRVTVGTVVAFALYLISLFDPIARLGDWYSEFQSGPRGAHEDRRPARRAGDGRRRHGAAAATRARCVADGLTFAYDGAAPAVVGRLARGRAGRAPRARRRDRAPASRRSRSCSCAPTTRSEGAVSFGGVDLRDAPLDELRAAHRLRPAGGPSVLRLDRRQRPARAARRPATTRCARRCARSARSSASTRCPRGSPRTSARAACASRRASGSSSRSRASRSSTRR